MHPSHPHPRRRVPKAALALLFSAAMTAGVAPTAQAQFGTPAIADAGEDFWASEWEFVQLDGTGSYDLDGDGISFAWTQIDGPAVLSFTGTGTATPTLQVPFVDGLGGTMTFQLRADDPDGFSTDTVNVHILAAVVPLPAAAWLLGGGLAALLGLARRRGTAAA